ncbi:MAG: ABC-F family ATP-binding cassette domain-containing protein [Bacteroidetes bacterium]|uniref:ABC-F family ATP-binding cassette domain-containing protein n=1 Tax=Candidatus Cryptobacteroides excrementavium TaxID=2840759 RepID=A0A9D9J4C4_9BACT|nr:ABC-F family ATP-binding cassette domain-containing protein [Candidatus Cryptobacteroides excrementavium]
MASYLQIENISKSYGPKILFEHIGFNINEGDKIALIAPNGTGKTSLLKILAGEDKSDSGGKIVFLKDIRIAFLQQEYDFDPEKSVFDQIMSHSTRFTSHLDQEHLWEYERRVKQHLTNFRLTDFSQKMKELSGGEVKRAAIAEMLATEADFYIMDEPTNHLDIDAIEFLENFLSRSRCTLLMVTHDRYFLDRVCNTVMELDHGALYVYKGNYANFLEKRSERIANWNAETDKVRNIFRRELEWMRSTPQARTGKARHRIDAFHELKDRAFQTRNEKQVSMAELSGSTRLGTKIIDCKDVSFFYGDKCYLSHFSYNFQRYEKVGITGGNGAGKSTFVNLLTGNYTPEMVATDPASYYGADGKTPLNPGQGLLTGKIERGESLKIGYYRQKGITFNPEDTVLDIVNDTRLLGRFLFPHDMLHNKVEKLSGGEKRRLYLLTILMQQPNMLVMDEPTNDLDIVTLNILEEYLKEFNGTLVIISHDRHFLDRLADHLFVFCGDGVVKDFTGIYSQYREFIKEQAGRPAAKEGTKASSPAKKETGRREDNAKKKLTYEEQKELEQTEKDLESLNNEKETLENSLNSGTLSYEELQKASARIGEIMALIDEKETRWLELSC